MNIQRVVVIGQVELHTVLQTKELADAHARHACMTDALQENCSRCVKQKTGLSPGVRCLWVMLHCALSRS